MHLDEAVLVGDGAVDDEEDVVAVVVDLRALAEVLGVLDRERVELEDVAEDLEVLRVGLVEIEPEERSPARSSSTFSRLKCISSLPRSWMTMHVFGGVRFSFGAGSPIVPSAVVPAAPADRRGSVIVFSSIAGGCALGAGAVSVRAGTFPRRRSPTRRAQTRASRRRARGAARTLEPERGKGRHGRRSDDQPQRWATEGRNILFEAIPGARRRGESGRPLGPPSAAPDQREG